MLVLAGCGARAEPATTLLFVGDMMLGRSVQAEMEQRQDWTFPFRRLAHRLRAADLTFGNLECVTAASGTNRGPYPFRADPRTLAGLAAAGFDIVSVANSHTSDWGPDALEEMLGHLRERGIASVGIDAGGAVRPPVVLRAGRLRVGFLAYSHFTGGPAAARDRTRIAGLDRERIERDVAAGRAAADYLVVSLHMGQEFAARSNAAQQALARAAIDAGADLVVGHHPHVPQEVEKYGRGFIAYSLGDFVFDHRDASVDGAMLAVTLGAGRVVGLREVRTRINERFQPEATTELRWEGSDLEGPDRVLG